MRCRAEHVYRSAAVPRRPVDTENDQVGAKRRGDLQNLFRRRPLLHNEVRLAPRTGLRGDQFPQPTLGGFDVIFGVNKFLDLRISDHMQHRVSRLVFLRQ
jgi:hypothetical protein